LFLLEPRPELQVIGRASDGLEAVQKAAELQPDLIVLDIGLPKLSGLEAATRILKLSPPYKILFLSQETSSEVVQEALSLGARGYVHKLGVGKELLVAIEAILAGRQFIGSGLMDYRRRKGETRSLFRHEVQFYSDDAVFLESFAQFIAAALKAGNPAIVIATKSHLDALLQRLKTEGVDVDTAIENGNLVRLDVFETLSTFMVNDMPDPDRFFEVADGLFEAASKAAKGGQARIAACGECAPLLCAEGKPQAALRLEQLWDQVAKTHEVDVLCGYALSSFHGDQGQHFLESICSEHSAIHSG